MRKTGAGHLLVEIGRGTSNVDRVNSAIKKTVGGSATVTTLTQTARIGIFGLDKIRTPEEVEQAFNFAIGEDSTVKVVMRK